MSDNKLAAFQILTFLQSAITKGDVKADDAEGLEVAIQCIAEAFGVDPEKEADKKAYSIEPATLPQVLAAHKAIAAAASTSAAAPPPAPKALSDEEKTKAEAAKAEGNKKMAQKDYQGAIAAYGKAIEIDGSNPVYFSNRAAAYSQVSKHSEAISDARAALVADPSFSKAYSRLGHALFSSGEYAEAVEAYEKGLELDPNNATMKSSLTTAKSRVPESSSRDVDDDAVSPSPRAGGAGAGGFPGFPGMGGGGMPDLASMMQNPAIMQMAQQMMQNGGLEQLMNNPMLQQMMNGAGGNGGMPDINALMNDPTMRRMAEQFGAGMGGAGRRSGDDDDSSNGNMYS